MIRKQAKKIIKTTAKKTIHKAHSVQPVFFAMGSVVLAVLIVVGAISRDVEHFLH